jgi:glucosamine-6-phosphate deaminase
MCEDESTVHVRFGNFDTSIYESNAALASAAAEHASQVIERAVRSNGSARVVMATGNSQLGFVQALNQECAPWHLVTVFHMDEYIGLNADHPASFVRWIHDRVEVPLKPGCVHYLCGDVKDPEVECQRYELLLREAPIDLVCMGIGENGHIAFNEPNAARFDDERWVRVIRLDDASRRQ